MNDTYIVTAYSVLDDLLKAYGYTDDVRATIGAAEILTVAVVAAKYFRNHHERALCIFIKLGDIPPLSVSRFNRRLHALSDWLYGIVTLLGELNEAIQTYDALADFDTEDVAGTITDVSAEIGKLAQYHSDLWAIFRGVDTDDSEAMERFLEPEDRRQEFYDALNAYARTLKVALASVVFYEQTPEATIQLYKRDLKFFHNLRASVKLRYAEAIDYRDYEEKIRKLLDSHIGARGVMQLTAEVEIFDREEFDHAVEQLSSPRARAEAILNHLKRTAIEKMETDPAYYRRFSEMIEDTLKAIEEGRMDALDGLAVAQDLREQELSGQRRDLPAQLHKFRDAPAYFGVMRDVLDSGRLSEDTLADMAIQVEHLIEDRKIRDWQNNGDVQNEMKNVIEDFLYAIEDEHDVRFSNIELDEIVNLVIDIAKKRS